ncbi:hypothetical protein HMPREF9402_1951 [Turicibacter sp. HGF1]|jgi:hypothetical protein|nr:hypothetical protein HMPREF9402_1951 [Turicibacter sp. HGF1]
MFSKLKKGSEPLKQKGATSYIKKVCILKDIRFKGIFVFFHPPHFMKKLGLF